MQILVHVYIYKQREKIRSLYKKWQQMLSYNISNQL